MLEVGEHVRLDVVLVRRRALEVEMRGLGLRSLMGLSLVGHRCLLLLLRVAVRPCRYRHGGPGPRRKSSSMVPRKRKARLVTLTQAGPYDGQR
ncbi:hypothetical protein GCM10022403_037670 [Streptomyces coacervatus]|uniref:Uncharacterized protein n=1 Tax=Streptomyces coacervatus TaxID=647381 RepID=A0ABP7HTP0_9ACTN